MLFWITLLLTLGAVAADIFFYFRRVRHSASRSRRLFFVAWTALTDALPFLIAVIFTFCRDNTTTLMYFTMWTFFIYLLTVLPRMIFYLVMWIHFPRIAVAAALCMALLLIWGATRGRTTLLVNRVEIRSEKLPETFNGFRIVQFSDTHIGAMVRPEKELQRLVDTINALHPDLIVFSGDLVNIRYTELNEKARAILGKLYATYGVVSTLGNHDVGLYVKDAVSLPPSVNIQRLLELQREMGWRVLDDETEYIVRGCDSISVSGISFDPALQQFRHSFDLPNIDLSNVYKGVPEQLFNLTVSHLPQLWPNIEALGYGDLTLAGHVHSMQMQLRLFGRKYSPAQWMYDRWSGLYQMPGSNLYINDGIGYVVYPMRLGAYPEITLFTLQR